MGQFYKGTEATFIDDAMFKLPYELMGKVIDKKDAEVQGEIDTTVALLDKLKAQALKKDEPALNNIIKGYETQVENIVSGIKNNVFDYDKYSYETRKLSRDITSNWSTGDVSKIQGNREAYLENVKAIREDAKKNPDKVLNNQGELLIKKAYEDYAGYKDDSTGEYRDYDSKDLAGTDPITDHVEKAIKGTVGEFTEIERDTETGGLRIKVDNKWQGWKPDELAGIFSNYIKANPNIDSALMQREMLGLSSRDAEITAGFDYMVNKYQKRQIKDGRGSSMSEQGKMDYAKKLKDQEDASRAILGMTENFDTTGNTSKDVYEERFVLDKSGRKTYDKSGKPITQKVKLAPLSIWNKIVGEHKSNWDKNATVANEAIKGWASRLGPGVLNIVTKTLQDSKIQKQIGRGDFSAFEDLFEGIRNNKNISLAEKTQMMQQKDNYKLALQNSAIDSDVLVAKQNAYLAFRNAQLKAENKPLLTAASKDPKGFGNWLASQPAKESWGLNNVNMKGSAALAGLSKGEQKELEEVGQNHLNQFSFSVDQFQNVNLTDSKGKTVKLNDIATNGKVTFKDLVTAGIIIPSTKSVTEMEDVTSEITNLSSKVKQTYNVFVNGKPVEIFTSGFLPLDRKNNKGEDALGTGINMGPGLQVVATLPVSQLSNSKIQDMLHKTSKEREYMFRMNTWPAGAKITKTVGGKTWEIGRDEVKEITQGVGADAPVFSTTEGWGKELVKALLYF